MLFTFNKNIDIPSPTEKTLSGKAYVNYGDDNQFPQFLYDLYSKSATLQSIINGTADFVFGDEIKSTLMETDEIKKVILDYLIFGGFSIQLFYYQGKCYQAKWIDFMNCRRDEDETKVIYSNKWGSVRHKAITYDVWTEDFKEGTCIYYFKGHKTRGIYPVPSYIGALKSIVVSTEISNFHLHNIMNGFNSNFILNFNNGVPDEETQDALKRQIEDTFCGTNNAGAMMVTWNDDQTHSLTVERIQSDDFDTKYQSLAEFVRQDIFTAFRATPALFGLPNETTGFSQQEYFEAFTLYNKTAVAPIQNDIIRVLELFGDTCRIEPFKLEKYGV